MRACSSTAPQTCRKQGQSRLDSLPGGGSSSTKTRQRFWGHAPHTHLELLCVPCSTVCRLAWGWWQLDKDVALPKRLGHTRRLKVHGRLHLLRWHKAGDEGARPLAMALLLEQQGLCAARQLEAAAARLQPAGAGRGKL